MHIWNGVQLSWWILRQRLNISWRKQLHPRQLRHHKVTLRRNHLHLQCWFWQPCGQHNQSAWATQQGPVSGSHKIGYRQYIRITTSLYSHLVIVTRNSAATSYAFPNGGGVVSMKRRAPGFTLIELLVAIAILSVLAKIGVDTAVRERQREQVNALTISLAGWLEQVRRSSLRGAGCTATINGTATAGSTVATAVVTPGTTTAIDSGSDSSMCLRNQPLTMNDISAVSPNSSYTLTSTSIGFTPRGTVATSTGNAVNILVTLQPSGPSRCISIQGLLGLLTISRGDQCGVQARF